MLLDYCLTRMLFPRRMISSEIQETSPRCYMGVNYLHETESIPEVFSRARPVLHQPESLYLSSLVIALSAFEAPRFYLLGSLETRPRLAVLMMLYAL